MNIYIYIHIHKDILFDYDSDYIPKAVCKAFRKAFRKGIRIASITRACLRSRKTHSSSLALACVNTFAKDVGKALRIVTIEIIVMTIL